MASAYEQLNFLNQQTQQNLVAPINNFLAQRNQIAMQQAEAARQRAQMIEMEQMRQQHALAAQKANFEYGQQAAEAAIMRARTEENRKILIDAGWDLAPDITPEAINAAAAQHLSRPEWVEEPAVERATATAGRIRSVLEGMTKDMATDTPEMQKKALMAFASDPANMALLTDEGKVPQAALIEVVNKGDVNGMVNLINTAARNAGWFSSDKQVSSQLLANLYGARATANQALQASPMFQAKQAQLQTLMQEFNKSATGIATRKGWDAVGNAFSPPGKSQEQLAKETKELLLKQEAAAAAQAKALAGGAAKQARVATRLAPPEASASEVGLIPWGVEKVRQAMPQGDFQLPRNLQEFALMAGDPFRLSQSPVAQDLSSGVMQGLYGRGDMVQRTSPHEQLARDLYARGIYDPRLGVPEQLLKGGF